MRFLHYFACAVLFGCAVTSVQGDDIEDPLGTSIDDKADGTTEASAGALLFANEATHDELRAIHLSERVATGIVSHRVGRDGVLGTADDDLFDDLAELGTVPYVGPRVAAALSNAAIANGDEARATADLDVMIDDGTLHGVHEGAATAFFGIPYAQPPVGALRWRAPQPPSTWSGTRSATTRAPSCIQVGTETGTVGQVLGGQEDCLTVNVWRPTGETGPLPVLVFIHGGFFLWGSASDFYEGVYSYDGRHIAMEHAIVVTLQYRLGALGYLASSALAASDPDGYTGNYGLLDQIAALDWVQHNIGAFGGDPSHVMVFGESAGGCSVSYLLASPAASGLFQSAMVESGCTSVWPKLTALAAGKQLAIALGCTGEDTTSCLRATDAKTVATAISPTLPTGGYQYSPNADPGVLEDPYTVIGAGAHNHVPVIVGTTSEEYNTLIDETVSQPITSAARYSAELAYQFGSALVPTILSLYPLADYTSPRDAMIAVFTDEEFACQARKLSRAIADNQSQPVYRYLFTHTIEEGPDQSLGPGHGVDLVFFFDQFATVAVAGSLPAADELSLAHDSIGYLVQLAATGNPNGLGAADWPRYNVATDPYQVLDTPIGSAMHLSPVRCDFWDTTGFY